jgi:hypothetical protein
VTRFGFCFKTRTDIVTSQTHVISHVRITKIGKTFQTGLFFVFFLFCLCLACLSPLIFSIVETNIYISLLSLYYFETKVESVSIRVIDTILFKKVYILVAQQQTGYLFLLAFFVFVCVFAVRKILYFLPNGGISTTK